MYKRIIGDNGSSFSHRDLMSRIKAVCCNITIRAYKFSIPSGTKSITAILDNPEIVFLRNSRYLGKVVRNSQSMSYHDKFRLFRNCFFNFPNIDIECFNIDINKNRCDSILNSGINGRRESKRYGDVFITTFEGSILKNVGGERS